MKIIPLNNEAIVAKFWNIYTVNFNHCTEKSKIDIYNSAIMKNIVYK